MNIGALWTMAVLLIWVTGCATNILVHDDSVLPDNPNGIVVNKRIIYAVSASVDPDLGTPAPSVAQKAIAGVDQHRMITLNISRQIFASGKLALELTKEQTLKNVALTSESGAARSLDAGKAIVEAIHPKPKATASDQ